MSLCQAINKPFVSIKILLFCWFGALSSAQIYMTVYLKNLGINAQITSLLTAVYPLSRIIGPSIFGPIADKTGRYKPILYFSFVVQILVSICFLLVSYSQNTSTFCSQQLVFCSNDTMWEDSLNTSINETQCSLCIHACPESRMTQIRSNCHKSCQEDYYLCNLQETENHTLNHVCYEMNIPCHDTISADEVCFINNTEPFKNINDYHLNTKFFTLLLISYCIYQVSIAIAYTMVETTTLTMVKHYNGNYGNQRIWAIIGMSLFAPLSGLMVDYLSAKKNCVDYSPAFYIFIALTIVNIISVFSMDLTRVPPSQNMLKDMCRICRYKVSLFLSSMFFHGIFYGFMESYLFWYLQDMKSPKYLMGLTLALSNLCALPFSYLSKKIIDKFGCVSFITIAFFIFSACSLAYSFLSNPWLAPLVQIPDSIFYQLMWISAATHSTKLVPDNLLASIQSAMVISHFGLGRGIGTITGGSLIHAYGEHKTFRCMGVSAGIVAVIYSVLFYYSKTKSSSN